MKRMWIQLSEVADRGVMKEQLKEIGRVEEDSRDGRRLILTFHNQSEGGMRMAGFRLTQDFIQEFVDFGMLGED
jgi:hypothetical protein